ncbi:hypothetical protein P5673_002378 [Acropora cervicornis]|uniref:Uncharacterized protein n=1 Tax=Acropora cervicornis TaxID=6130 RepID=A0AAD9R3I0_ACRCE|nr:hypothetical protein P5673_002378 [Acropora cervicornis]
MKRIDSRGFGPLERKKNIDRHDLMCFRCAATPSGVPKNSLRRLSRLFLAGCLAVDKMSIKSFVKIMQPKPPFYGKRTEFQGLRSPMGRSDVRRVFVLILCFPTGANHGFRKGDNMGSIQHKEELRLKSKQNDDSSIKSQKLLDNHLVVVIEIRSDEMYSLDVMINNRMIWLDFNASQRMKVPNLVGNTQEFNFEEVNLIIEAFFSYRNLLPDNVKYQGKLTKQTDALSRKLSPFVTSPIMKFLGTEDFQVLKSTFTALSMDHARA